MSRACLVFLFLFIVELSFAQQNTVSDSNFVRKKSSFSDISISESFISTKLADLLLALEENYSINFSYVNEFIPLNTKVSIIAENDPLEFFLNKLFSDLPVEFVIVGEQIVLVKSVEFESLLKSETRETSKNDSVYITPVNRRKQGQRRRFSEKISLFDLMNGNLFFYDKESIPPVTYEYPDSTEVDSDSLLSVERKLRRARVRLIKNKNWSKYSFFLMFQPELTRWKLKGTANQSIDYSRYNDYKSPDLSLSIQLGTSYRFYRSLFFRPAIVATLLTKKGIHTNYHVSVFNPTVAHPVSYSYSSRYGYLSFSGQLGYENKYKKSKLVAAIGYFYGVMVTQTGPEYFPFYEPKYYASGPVFYNSKLEILKPEKIPYRQFLPGIIADITVCRKVMEDFELIIGVSSKILLQSIYLKSAPVSERSFTIGLSLGLRYNLEK